MARISLWVVTDDPETIARVAENFARTGAGLVLDGVHSYTSFDPDSDEEEPEDD